MRALISYVLPLLLPTVLYILYMAWVRQRAQRGGNAPPGWQEGPVFWAVLGGLLLVVGVLITLFVTDGQSGIDKIYHPARSENGMVMPGRFRHASPPPTPN